MHGGMLPKDRRAQQALDDEFAQSLGLQ